jgi:hypothetical protein
MQEINKKILVLWVGILGLLSQVSGQMPNWSPPQAGDFQYSATALAQVFFEGELQTQPGDRLAVFAGGQIRGLSSYVNGFHFLTVYSNVPQESLHIFYYSAERDSVYLALTPFSFVVGSHQGSAENPLSVGVFQGNDAPIDLLPLPDVLGLQSFPLAPIDLGPYLVSLDGDPVDWSVLPHGQIQAQINGSQLQLIPSADFTGMAVLTLVATEVTDNAYQASTELLVTLVPLYAGPGFEVVPGQGTVVGTPFVNLCNETSSIILQLSDFEEAAVGCVSYDYLPVVQVEAPATPRPDWQVNQTYPNNFSVVASVVYTPNFPLTGADNLLMATVNGEIRGVAPPILQSGEIRYYLNVGGGPGDEEVLLHFYSQERGLIYQWKDTLPYLAGSQIGSQQEPLLVDVSPLLPLVDALGQVEMVIQYPAWIGEQSFTYFAYDCTFPDLLNSSSVASYCVVTSEQDLTYYYRDRDEDGYGDVHVFTRNCSAPQGFIDVGLDCRDDDPQISPSGPFYCVQDVDLYLDASGSATLLPEMTDSIRPYVCGTDSLKLSKSLFGCEDLGSQLVQYSIYDLNGNFDFSLILVSVFDTLAPQFTCPDPIVLSSCQQEIPDLEALIEDISDNCSSWQISQQPPPGTLISSFSGNAVEVQIKVIDESGQETLCIVPVSVQDTLAPQFMNCPQDQNFIVGLLEGSCQGVGLWSIPYAQDDCGIAEVQQTQGPRPDSLLSVGIYLIEYTAQDSAGNATTCRFTLEVIDTADPIIVCPGNLLQFETDPGQCTWTSPPGSLTPLLVWSPCEAQYSWEVTGATQGSGQGDLSGLVFELGSSEVEYTLVETASGQSWSCSFTVEVRDRETPVITCPAPLVLECGEEENGALLEDWLASVGLEDNCTAEPSLEVVLYQVDTRCGNTAMHTYRFRALDAQGNAQVCYATVTYQDTQPPLIVQPAQDRTVQCDGTGNDWELQEWLNQNAGAQATEGCSDSLQWNYVLGPWQNECNGTGFVEVTFFVKDECNHYSSTQARFTRIDTLAPSWQILPQPLLLECDDTGLFEGQLEAWLSTAGGGLALDECSAVTYTHDYTGLSGGCSGGIGQTTVTFRATDACGNSRSHAVFLEVQDRQAPEWVLPTRDTLVECDGSGNLQALQDWIDHRAGALAYDACSGVETYEQEWLYTLEGCGNTLRHRYRFTALDACGNRSPALEAEFAIVDRTPPAFVRAPSDLLVECDGQGNTEALELWLQARGGALALDVCSGEELVWTYHLVNTLDLCGLTGTQVFQFTVTDPCGNSSSAQAKFTIVDREAPVISGGEDVLWEECEPSPAGNFPSFQHWLETRAGATATDVCGSFSWSHDYDPDHWIDVCGNARYVDVTFTAQDVCGNASQITRRFSIGDSEKPRFLNCPSLPLVVSAPQGWCQTFVNFSPLQASDNCGEVIIRQIDTTGLNSGSLFPLGLTLLIFEAEDLCGNKDTCYYPIVVNDYSPLFGQCPPDSFWDNDPGKCGAVVQSVGLRNWETACPQGTAILYRIEDPQGQVTGGGIDNLSGRFLPTGQHRITYEIWNQPRLLITSLRNTPEAVWLEITAFGPAALDLTWLTLESEGGEPFSITLPQGTVLQPGQSYVQAFPPQTSPTAYVVKFFDRLIDAVALGPYTGNSFPWTGVLEADHYLRKDLYNTFGQRDWLATDLCNAPETGQLNPLLLPYVYDWNGAVRTLQTVQIPPTECSFEIFIEDAEAPVCAQVETQAYPGSTGAIGAGQCSSFPVAVTEDILVSRLHLSHLQGSFPQMMGLTAHLVSPSGTRVLLFENLCNTTADFDLNVSDRAPQTLATVLCGPMGQGGAYQPLESFKAFAGESSQGEWVLELQTELPLEGSLLSWTLELEALSPYEQPDVVLSNEAGLCGASFDWTHVYFSDNCCEGSLRVDYQRTDGGPKPQGGVLALGGGGSASEFFAVGTTTVIYTLEDAVGNVSTCSFEVKVEDLEAPVLGPGSCPSPQIVLGPTQCSTLYPYPTLEVADNCGIASIVYDPAPGYFFPIGITPVTAVVEDLSGNTVTCSFTVTVLEYLPPVTTLFCNDQVQLSLGPDCRASIGADLILEGGNYRCYDNYCITLRDASGQIIGSSQEGTNFVDASHVGTTIEATLCSCLDSQVNCCTVAIEVQALSLPKVQCPEDVTLACNGDLHPDALGRPVLTNCVPSATMDYYDTFENGGVCGEPRAVLLRRWVIQNDKGDKVECEQRITILPFDNDKIVFPEDKVLDCAAVALQPALTHPDFSGLPRIGDQPLFGAHLCEFFAGYTDVVLQDANCSGGYQILRTWIIRNECLSIIPGVNPVTHTQTLHVDDSEGPEFLVSFDDVTLSTQGLECHASYSLGKVSDVLVDFCSEVAEVTAVASGCQIVKKASGELVIERMGKGKHQVKVIARDDCWNYSESSFEITVEDRTPPVAVCKSQVTVALSTEGVGRLYASSLDNGSYDNCGSLRFEVERPVGACGGKVKGEYVDFCCEDLGPDPIRVVLRVWDDADGNGIFGTPGDYYNECEVEIALQSLIPPVVLCPEDKVLQCFEDPFDLVLTGAPVLLEGCEGLVFEYIDQIDLHACGHGTIIRDWTLPGFASVGCTQILVLQAPRPLDPEVDIRWPQDVTVDCAGVGSLPGPEWEDVLCSSIGVSFKDQLYFSVPNYCYKVERTWTLIDACVFEPNNPQSPGVYTHQQWISVSDQRAPELASCDTLVLGWVEGSCALGNVVVQQSAVNFDCGIGTPLVWRYRLDLGAKGTFDLEGEALGEAVEVVLPSVPLGEHALEWQVTDACGNVTTCVQTLVVRDVEAPALLCSDEIVVVPMQDGSVEVAAAFFVLQASDNCTPAQDLQYSFAPHAAVPVLTFGCEDIPNGQSQSVDLSVYVSDASGNASFCQVRLLLQDNQDVCPDQDDLILGFVLSGQVKDRRGEPIRYVETLLNSDFPHFPKVDTTLAGGEYGFADLPQPGKYEVQLSRETDFRQGVSTLDFALLQRHLLGLQPFDSPFQLLASDLNADQKVGAEDLFLLRDLVLARRVALPGIPSWGFVPQSHLFSIPLQPWPMPDKLEILSLQPSPQTLHFTGWKMGDVNGNASGQSVEVRSPVRATFLLEDLWLEAGEEIPVAWKGQAMDGLMGWQFTLQTQGLSLVAMVPGALSMNSEALHVYSPDKITVSWASIDPVSLSDEQVLFTAVLKAEESGWLSEKLGWSLAPTTPEAYLGEDLKVAGLDLKFESREGQNRYALHQNEPNPFRQETKILFELPEAQTYRIAVFTPSGQEVYSEEAVGNAGLNELRLDSRILGAQGVLYYTIQSGGYSATRKMIQIE